MLHNINRDYASTQDEFPTVHAELVTNINRLLAAVLTLLQSRKELDERDARFYMDMKARETAANAIALLLHTARVDADSAVGPTFDHASFTALRDHFDNRGVCVCLCVCLCGLSQLF